MAWYDGAWKYRRKITVDHDNIDSNLTDHPLLITETNFPDVFWFHVKANGSDIVLTSSDGITKLKRELVSINITTKKIELWVKTNLTAATDTILYIYFGNPDATETNDSDTWDSDFDVVYHLNEDPAAGAGSIQDSTSNERDGTPNGGMDADDLVDGKIGKCLDFDGADDFIEIVDYKGVGGTTVRTCELWVKSDAGDIAASFIAWGINEAGKRWNYRLQTTVQRIEVHGGFHYGDTDVHDDVWHHIAVVLPSGESAVEDTLLYVDGGLDGVGGTSAEPINTDVSADATVAHFPLDAFYLLGLIDEVRISKVDRSAAYFKATYLNVTDEANFYSIGDREKPVGLSWNLAYWNGSIWIDITKELKAFTSVKYGIDNRIQGFTPVMNILLDSAATYGTNKYKLEIGDNYFLFSAPFDGIVSYPNYMVSITLIDYLFNSLHNKAPLSSATFGESAADGFGGGKFAITSTQDFKALYKTKQHDIEITGFTTYDDINHYDGLGNNIEITEALRYATEGVIHAKDHSENIGYAYPTINEILSDIITGEDLTLQVDYGYPDEASSSGSTTTMPSTPFKIWDVKIVNNHILVLCSNEGYLRLRSYDAAGVYKDETYWTSRDFKENLTGVDHIGFLIHPDYYNGKAYIPMWKNDNYTSTGLQDYLLRISKISVNADTGALTVDYNDDYTEEDLFKTTIDAAIRPSGMTDTNFRTRLTRWQHYAQLRGSLGAKHNYLYADGIVTNFVIFKTTGTDTLYVIDPDKHEAEETPWKWEYTNSTEREYWDLCPDNESGNVVLITKADSTWYKEIFRVNMTAMIAGNAISIDTGELLLEDDPDNNVGRPSGAWREATHYDNDDQFYFPAQLPNGLLYKVEVQNRYSRTDADYIGFGGAWAAVDFAGASWNPYLDRALVWKANLDLDPTTLSWKIGDNYAYKRLYLYQPYIYNNEKLQFIDAFVGFGFFYQQVNNVVRLFRIRGTGTSLGTLSDILFYENLQGFTRFADIFSVKVLDRNIPFGSGTVTKQIKTIMGKYGFISPSQISKYTDWYDKLKSSSAGIKVYMGMDVFYGITGTYIPELGKTFIYDEDTYILIEVRISLLNWIIELTGIKEV